jgi:hypothetical protein
VPAGQSTISAPSTRTVLDPQQPKDAAALSIDFRTGGSALDYAISGWSYPEADFTWTQGNRSLIRLPFSGPAVDHALRLRLGPMVRAGAVPHQRITILVNFTPVARLILRAPGQHELLVPAELLHESGSVQIEFLLPDAISPKALGNSNDTRDLGIWLGSLSFEPLVLRAPDQDREADKALLMDLQSLGENCELGFVQRAAGAEPLGLFRWANTPRPNLLRALDARFAGLGEPDQLDIELDGAGEYQVIDTRFGFRNHSYIFVASGATAADVKRRELTRLPYLARLLIDDLEGGQRLFCFHDAGASSQDRAAEVLAAINRYGSNTLLWVTRAQTEAAIGTASWVAEGLIRGQIDRFEPLGNVRAPSMDSWLSVIRAAHALWRAG